MSSTEHFLYEKMDILRESGAIESIPFYMESGLASHIQLREYQREALENFVTYMENPRLRGNGLGHLLFHSATGSGKTVMMAAMILYMYTKGYNRVLFFVDQRNIIEKTKDNFLNPKSNKYLFNEPLEILGNQVPINLVSNFSSVDENAINICFSTIQGLHNNVRTPKENELSITDFEEKKVLLISDEAHHINTWTMRKNREDEEVHRSWEETIMEIHRSNVDNVLLEFTATANISDPNVRQKYLNKMIYDYPLKKFRASGYTKDFDNLQTDYDVWERTLIALVISEYRRYLFADYRKQVKPVILFKSKRVVDSETFYKEFFIKLRSLTQENIRSLENTDSSLLKRALDYFKEKDDTYHSLLSSIQISFQEENALILNNESQHTKEVELAVNSLEDKENPYRLIFTVNMLNEGWDVLNLYDIVRLFETRSSQNATIKEAQLIGRGARYYPFVIEEGQEPEKRKYDYDLENENRILETMLYHSKQDNRYISELRTALKETGLLPEEVIEQEYELKDSFKESEFYKTGKVFVNRKIPKNRSDVRKIDGKIRNYHKRISVSSGRSALVNFFDEDRVVTPARESVPPQTFTMKELPLHILYAGVESYDALNYDQLKDKFPNLTSLKGFLTSDDYVGGVTIVLEGVNGTPTATQLFEAVKSTLMDVAVHVSNIKGEFEGTKTFEEKPVQSVVRNKKIRITDKKEIGLGAPQSRITGDLALDLSDKSWFVYTEHYGTEEEKAFVKYFHEIYGQLHNEYDSIYLIRNERIADLAIYTFDSGERFEPDFLLFLQKEKSSGFVQQQIFIEPKGSHLLSEDAWKEEFLKEIHLNGETTVKYVDDNDYLIYGLPFFNTNHTLTEFKESLETIIQNK